MSNFGDGGSWFEISDLINDLSINLINKTNNANSTFKKEFIPSFCKYRRYGLRELTFGEFFKDFSMKLKHHSIQNTILRSSLYRGFSIKSLSSNHEKNWKLHHLDIKSFETKIYYDYDYDLDLSIH